MKTRKDTILKFIAIPFIMIAFTIILLSSNVKAANDTTVTLKQDGQNVKVSLSPKEGASIASFQIGLKIEASKAADIKNVTFNWANIGNAKLKKESYDKEKGILNLYVVTEAEQNTGASIDVGTIKIETNKNTKVTVSPIADKLAASSIAHKDTKVDAKASDKITYTANNNSGNTGDNNNQGGNTGDNQGGNNSGNQGDNNSGSQGGNNSGSGSQGGNHSNSGNTGNDSTGNGNNSNSSNSGSNTDSKNDEDNDKEDENNKENDEENNVEDNNEIDNKTSSNQVDNVATGTLPQTGEKDNFIVVWIFMALVVLVGVLLAFGYKSMNKKNTFKL